MSMHRNSLHLTGLLLLLQCLSVPGTALAYVDPNSASLAYQILFPLVVSVTAGWRWVKRWTTSIWIILRTTARK